MRDGRRVAPRVWDEARLANVTLRFTTASRDLWVGAARLLPALARFNVRRGVEGARANRRLIRDMIPAAPGLGDWLIYALAWRHADAYAGDPEARAAIRTKLCAASPLAALFALAAPTEEPILRLPQRAGPILECLDEALAAAWRAALDPAGLAVDRVDTLARTAACYLAAIGSVRRLDLARPLIDLVAHAVHTFSDVTRFERPLRPALARVVALGRPLVAHRMAMIDQRYGDERYEEAQAFLAFADAPIAAFAQRIDPTVNMLSGIIG
jgi:hypothetical protein